MGIAETAQTIKRNIVLTELVLVALLTQAIGTVIFFRLIESLVN